jgi:hypothetical protein
MQNDKNITSSPTSAKELVISCIKALNEEDFNSARSYMSNDFKFEGVLGSRDSAEAYFEDMKKMKLKYRIKKAFVDDDDVCLLYDLTMSAVNIFGCGWYHVEDGKINKLKVIFDPRPLLEKPGKK